MIKYFITTIADIKELNTLNPNVISVKDNVVSLNNTNTENAIFIIQIIDKKAYITPNSEHKIIVGGNTLTDRTFLDNRSTFSINGYGDFIYWHVRYEITTIQQDEDTLLSFLRHNILPFNVNIFDVLKQGAAKLHQDELFSIVAQIDIPEIDQ